MLGNQDETATSPSEQLRAAVDQVVQARRASGCEAIINPSAIEVAGETVAFDDAQFSGPTDFHDAQFSGPTCFHDAAQVGQTWRQRCGRQAGQRVPLGRITGRSPRTLYLVSAAAPAG